MFIPRKSSLHVTLAVCCSTCFDAGSALASGAAPPTPSAPSSASKSSAPTLKPVDPGVADADPLATSGRILPTDLRQPANFDRVYEVELDGKRFFVRAHGGVYAVFPRSDYVQTRQGVIPIVPAGTVFHLGSLPKSERASSSAADTALNPANAKPARPARQDQTPPSNAAPTPESAAAQPAPAARPNPAQRQNTEPPTSDAAPPLARVPDGSTIWTSEMVRVSRTSELLDRARIARGAMRQAEDASRSTNRHAVVGEPGN